MVGNKMDVIIKEEEISLSEIAIFGAISFVLASLLGVILYVTCSKKYKLNWFEKSLLEAATEAEEILQSGEALATDTVAYNEDNLSESAKSLNRGNVSPNSVSDDPTFWIPSRPTSQTICHPSDESPPATPTSPTCSNKSLTLSTTSSTVPIARSDNHVVLAMNPVRLKVSSMQSKLDYTKINTSLYQKDTTVETPQPNEDIRGMVHLHILYDPIAGILTIRLIEAQDLQPRHFSGTADPYAKIRLLPDKKNVWQTRIHKKTLNPVFDEDFVFEEHPNVIEKRKIEILMYDFDAYSRHVCIGGTQIALANLDLSEKVDMWKPLGGCSEQDVKIDLGDLMVSLSFLPSAERLTVVVIKARNLRVVDDSRNSSDPYVKVSLISGGKKVKKRKTTVIRNTVSPVFNEALTFDIPKDTLKNSTIEFLVVHDSLLGSNEILGRAVLGHANPEVRPEEKEFFDEMFRAKSATAHWLPLADVKRQVK